MKLYQLDYVNCDKWLLHKPPILTKPNHVQLLEACQAFRTSENAESVFVQYLQNQQEISSKFMIEAKNLRAKMMDTETCWKSLTAQSIKFTYNIQEGHTFID